LTETNAWSLVCIGSLLLRFLLHMSSLAAGPSPVCSFCAETAARWFEVRSTSCGQILLAVCPRHQSERVLQDTINKLRTHPEWGAKNGQCCYGNGKEHGPTQSAVCMVVCDGGNKNTELLISLCEDHVVSFSMTFKLPSRQEDDSAADFSGPSSTVRLTKNKPKISKSSLNIPPRDPSAHA
jgi:hypothetical protein